MTIILTIEEINRIEAFSRWVGFASPPSRSAKFTITRNGDRFIRQEALKPFGDELSQEQILPLLKALARPAIPQLDPTVFELPSEVIESHFDSIWSSSYPALMFRIEVGSGRVITIVSEEQHDFMLPLAIVDATQPECVVTFDPELSRALGALLPDDFLNKHLISGVGAFEWELSQFEKKNVEIPPTSPAIVAELDSITDRPPTPVDSSTVSVDVEFSEAPDDLVAEETPNSDMMQGIRQILFGQESTKKAEELERSGQLSQRLLNRNSLETVRDLLARGADPSVADEAGQTALMHAAFPPLNRERFRLLVQAGADLEARRGGLTGLHLACAGGEADAAAEWVLAGADVMARCAEGATPLMLGASWPKVVRTLLNASADVNAIDIYRQNALTYAIIDQCSVNANDELEAIQLLIAAGVDVNQRDHLGISPLGHARQKLAEIDVDEEVALAFIALTPDAELPRGLRREDRNLAEAIIGLLIATGSQE